MGLAGGVADDGVQPEVSDILVYLLGFYWLPLSGERGWFSV